MGKAEKSRIGMRSRSCFMSCNYLQIGPYEKLIITYVDYLINTGLMRLYRKLEELDQSTRFPCLLLNNADGVFTQRSVPERPTLHRNERKGGIAARNVLTK